MTVEQLIKKLADCDPDAIVCVTDIGLDLVEISTMFEETKDYTDVYGNFTVGNVVTFHHWRKYES